MKRLNTLILALGFTLTIQAQAYMDSDQPNASKMLPAPPDTKSLGFVNDLTLYRWGKSAREESAGKLAYNFIMWDFDGFLRSLSKACPIDGEPLCRHQFLPLRTGFAGLALFTIAGRSVSR